MYKNGNNVTSDSGSGFERMRTDNAQTSFFEGREFRTFRELNVPQAGIEIIKATVPIDIVLFSVQLGIDGGWLRLATMVGITAGGTFSQDLPIFNCNTMTGPKDRRKNKSGQYYVHQTVLEIATTATGATFSGGTTLDVARLKTSGNANFSSTVGGAPSDERGVGPNTYYFVLQNLGADPVTGVFRARWEERANGFFRT